MKILITGITGFVGSHLAEYCKNLPRTEVFGTAFPFVKSRESKVKFLACDLTKKEQVEKVLRAVKPGKIFHLAGQSSPFLSWQTPAQTLSNNIVSQVNIFEAIRKLKLNPIVHIAGSADQYGIVYKNELPIKETNPFRPISPYSVSKIAQEMLANQYWRTYGLKTVVTRAFNHEGPGRAKHFAISSFAFQIAAIEKGKQRPVISVGDLSSRRDFCDVRDVVKAYWLATERCEYGKSYNVGSGHVWKIKDVLDILLSFSKSKIGVKKDPKLLRPKDVAVWQCDYSKLKRATGWTPKINFETTLLDTLNYWREKA